MVAFAETSRPTHRAYAPKCVGSSSCAPGKNPSLGVDRNQQYSITALTNASGTITERYAYTAYGQPVFFDGSGTVISASAESNRYTYTGREWDKDLVLYHYRARMYDAVSGRFLGRDPIGYQHTVFNLVQYVRSSPVNHVDPSGLFTEAGLELDFGVSLYLGKGGGISASYSVFESACCINGIRSTKQVQEIGLHGEIGLGLGGSIKFAGWRIGTFQWTVLTENIDVKHTCESPCGSVALQCCEICVSYGFKFPLGPGRSLDIGVAGFALELLAELDVHFKACYRSPQCKDPGLYVGLCYRAEVSATVRTRWLFGRGGWRDADCLEI